MTKGPSGGNNLGPNGVDQTREGGRVLRIGLHRSMPATSGGSGSAGRRGRGPPLHLSQTDVASPSGEERTLVSPVMSGYREVLHRIKGGRNGSRLLVIF